MCTLSDLLDALSKTLNGVNKACLDVGDVISCYFFITASIHHFQICLSLLASKYLLLVIVDLTVTFEVLDICSSPFGGHFRSNDGFIVNVGILLETHDIFVRTINVVMDVVNREIRSNSNLFTKLIN